MSANFILHIGAAKTGSSAVQSFLRRNAPELAEYGYVVPDRYLGLTSDITGEHVWAFQEYIAADDVVGLTARLEQAAVLAGEGKTILTSAENLSNLGNHKFLAEVCKGHDVRVVLYIRRQDDLLTSAWQQWHCKVEADFDAWLVRGLKRYGHWDKLTSDWESVVGAGKVAVRLFEREAMVGKDLLRDFVAAIGLAEHADRFDYNIGVINPSFTDVITPLVAGNTRLFENANDNKFFNFLLTVSPATVGESKKASLLSREMRNSIIGHYHECNINMLRKYFPKKQYLFNPIDHSKYIYLKDDSLVSAQMQIMTELLFRTFEYLKSHR